MECVLERRRTNNVWPAQSVMDFNAFQPRILKKYHLRQKTFSEAYVDEIILRATDTRGNPSRVRRHGLAVPNKATSFGLVLAALAGNAPFLFPITFGSDSPISYFLMLGLLLILILARATATSRPSIFVPLHSTCFGLLFCVYAYAHGCGYDFPYSWIISTILLSSTLSITPEFFPSYGQRPCRMRFSACLMLASLLLSLFSLLHRTCPVPLCVALMVHQMACFLFLLSVLRDDSVNSPETSAAAESLSAIDEHDFPPIPDIETGMEVEDAIAY